MRPQTIIFWDVDTQADFMLPGGNLYVPGAETTIPNLRRLTDAARQGHVFLVSDVDVHAPDDPEFQHWPPHCVQGTPGQQKIPETMTECYFVVPNRSGAPLPADWSPYQQLILEKQTLDVFDNPNTEAVLERLGCEPEFIVYGVVTEYCVRLAARGLLERGRRVALITDATCALKAEDGLRALDELCSMGARLITTDEALRLVESESHTAVRGHQSS